MNVSQEILTRLSALIVDARQGRPSNVIIAETLDRKTYQKVNEVLEALGGKWSRKEKSHVFAEDPTEALSQVINTGKITTHKDLGFFATPAPIAANLVHLAEVQQGLDVLEPSAGEGALVIPCLERGAFVIALELDDKRRDVLKKLSRYERSSGHLFVRPFPDFLSIKPGYVHGDPRSHGYVDRVVMNPPFTKVTAGGDHIEHVIHAFSFLKPGGILVSVLPSSITFRQDRRHTAFRSWIEVHEGDVQELPANSFASSGTGVNTVTLRMVKQ